MHLSPSYPVLAESELRAIETKHQSCEPPLMERAGRAAAVYGRSLLGERGGCVLVLAGPGNNGGDGFVVARELRSQGVDVVVVSAAQARHYPPDAAVARQHWLDAGGQILPDFVGTQWGLTIDAMFGIGLRRPLEGVYAQWVERVNALECPCLALDLPSGLDAQTGALTGPCIRATHTATFIGYKPGLLTLDGPDHCGEICLFELDLPRSDAAGHLLGLADFGEWLKPRLHNVHKGSFGAAGVIGGASGMSGAAILAARAALHLGPGKVFLGMPGAEADAVDGLHPEIMCRNPGDLLVLASALAIGPGLGRSEEAHVLLRRATGFAGPLIVDADGINGVADDAALMRSLAARDAPTVLTPHPAEAARLLRSTVSQIQADRIASACELSRRFHAIVVLKGCGSIVASPSGHWFINTSGHGGMASGGMGDVLTGFIVALIAQGWSALEATLCAVHLHGTAADTLAVRGVGPVGLTASELLPAARSVFNHWLHQ